MRGQGYSATPEPEPVVGSFKTFSLEFTMHQPDPMLLGLLTGGALGTPPGKPTFALEMVQSIPVRRRAWRVVWEWLTRTPRQYTQHVTYLPHVTFAERQDDD